MKFRYLSLTCLSLAMLIVSACGSAESQNKAEASPTPEMTEFEREIRSLKTADFDHIYVFRRKDGEKMTAEDKRFIKDKAHFATNRFTLSKDEKVVFAGSNFEFEKENLEALKDRFDFEDFSKPPEQIRKEEEAANANAARRRANSNSNN